MTRCMPRRTTRNDGGAIYRPVRISLDEGFCQGAPMNSASQALATAVASPPFDAASLEVGEWLESSFTISFRAQESAEVVWRLRAATPVARRETVSACLAILHLDDLLHPRCDAKSKLIVAVVNR